MLMHFRIAQAWNEKWANEICKQNTKNNYRTLSGGAVNHFTAFQVLLEF